MWNDPPENAICITVRGTPRPGGSKTGFPIRRHDGRVGVAMADAAGDAGKMWRSIVALSASEVMAGREPMTCPVAVQLVFCVRRPGVHYTRRGAVKEKAPLYPATKPDLTKLERAVEDALTGIVWADDKQIVEKRTAKVYGYTPGVAIYVWPKMETP